MTLNPLKIWLMNKLLESCCNQYKAKVALGLPKTNSCRDLKNYVRIKTFFFYSMKYKPALGEPENFLAFKSLVFGLTQLQSQKGWAVDFPSERYGFQKNGAIYFNQVHMEPLLEDHHLPALQRIPYSMYLSRKT